MSIRYIYLTFIEYKNSEHTRIHHQALKEDMTEKDGTKIEMGGGVRRTEELMKE